MSNARNMRPPASSSEKKKIRVYDCRFGPERVKEKYFNTSGLDFNDFLRALHKAFEIGRHESFVLVNTDRTVLDFDTFAELQDDSTLHLLQQEDQDLPMATEETIKFEPHHETLTQCGTYEYYTSEGQNSLPYAVAELIDNSVSATASNKDVRTIEIRMLFDETRGKPAVIVLDNGRGMTSKQLRNWAVYRLSKFSKSRHASEREVYVRPGPTPCSLNSDISYFGIGGKQAVFYIGDSTRMITKAVGSQDVRELVLSKEDFERKEMNKEEIYSSAIKTRMPGDFSHVNKNEERFLHDLIAEEPGKDSFTAVVITGVRPEHITFLKKDFAVWTRQLAHVYHYYIHGVNGNDMRSSSADSNKLPKIDIQITMREKPPRCPRVINLSEVDDDMQTLYISAAADKFQFHVKAADGGTVDGIVRYHPFLYDKETYPQDPSNTPAPPDEENSDNESGILLQSRGKNHIFKCFWNGRLIPYTTISEFEWCTYTGRGSKVPEECFSRFSGVLFTNDKFKVTTNKLTFMDLELKLKNKETIFERNRNGQIRRSNIKTEFTQWLLDSHEKFDKEVKFLKYLKTITRADVVPKKKQHPWATFAAIEWDGKTYKKGQKVKSQKTGTILYGTVVQFLLYGTHDRDVFATGGQVEVTLEPKALYDQTKIIPISKIDRMATEDAIEMNIKHDLAKLPKKLNVCWPEGVSWPQDAVHPAGTLLGPLQVTIMNQKEESLSRMPSVHQATVIRLTVILKLVLHDPEGDKEIVSYVGVYSSQWGFWFNKIDKLRRPGKYTLFLKTVITESKATVFGGESLPSYKLKFTITGGSAERFQVGAVSPTLHVGVPFDVPLQIQDVYDNSAMPPPDLTPQLECRGLDVSYEATGCTGSTFTIRNVRVKGKVPNHQQSRTYILKVTLPGLKEASPSVKFSLLPGKPHLLHVMPKDDPVENGNPLWFNVETHDVSGNITANPKQMVHCQVESLPPMTVDCSSTGAGQLVTEAIHLKIINGQPQDLEVKFHMPDQRNIPLVVMKITVVPSTRVSRMDLYSQDDEHLVLRDHEKIEWLAGSLLENLFYKLYDEAGREVPLTAAIASMIKVNWTGMINRVDLAQGKLPDVQVPTQVQEGHFYQVSYQDQSVSVSFTVVPIPHEPTCLKVTLPQSTVKLGETLLGDINLELVDQYGNVTKTLTSTCMNDITVESEGLDQSALTFTWQESSHSVLVRGVRFQSGSPGSKMMCFTYMSFVKSVDVTVTAGLPAQLRLLSGPKLPLQVLNDHGIPTPFIVQLCDEWGNPSPDQKVVVQLRSSPSALKLMKSVTSQPVTAEGKATFTVHRVSGPKGNYQLLFHSSFNNRSLPGPSVNLTVFPDPNKPVRLSVEYDTAAKFPAGGHFPVFSVIVVSDTGSPITTFKPAAVSMRQWEGEPSGNTPPDTALELRCTKPTVNEKNDRFHFRDKEIPERVGKHTIQFCLCTDQTTLFSAQIIIDVVANEPVKLGPDSPPPTPVVFCCKIITNRTLVENMTLRIMDSYGNPAGQDLEGKVLVSIKSYNGDSNQSLPLFEGKIRRLQMILKDGKVDITRLAVMEDSPGQHGSPYILLFQPEVSAVSTPLASFELPFNFYKGVENQMKMSELSRQKDKLTAVIAEYQSIFDENRELLELMKTQHLDTIEKEAILRNELTRTNVKIPQAATIPRIDRLFTEKTRERERIMNTPRRVCALQNPFMNEPDVLGMVGHLALVQDDDAARVISWHIRGDMDCVITATTAAAKRVYGLTHGRQQVMAIDSIYVRPGNRQLPHIRNDRPLFEAPGNPVLARDLLIYTTDEGSCDMVFRNILGNAIIMDDLDSANSYRRAVVQCKMPCPTILTRQGDRLSSNGKFGGAQNKAPPIETLQVFGAPFPQNIYTLAEEIDLLDKYRSALIKREDAKKELEDQTEKMKSPEMVEKQLVLEEKKQQLETIERQLASTPRKREPADAAEPYGTVAKRQREMQ